VDTTYNYSYFPILIERDYPLSRDELYEKFHQYNVYARRYFYPLISEFPMYRGLTSASESNLPVANTIAHKVLCLPIYPDLSNEHVAHIVDIISGELS